MSSRLSRLGGAAARGVALLVLATCTSDHIPTAPPPPQTAPVAPPPVSAAIAASAQAVQLIGAGNIARCDRTNDEATALLLDAYPDATVFTAGDNINGNGSLTNFNTCYGPSWGRHKARTRPRLVPAPRRPVAGVEVGQRPIAVDVVAGREHRGVGIRVEQERRGLVVGAIAARDVAGADELHRLRGGGNGCRNRGRCNRCGLRGEWYSGDVVGGTGRDDQQGNAPGCGPAQPAKTRAHCVPSDVVGLGIPAGRRSVRARCGPVPAATPLLQGKCRGRSTPNRVAAWALAVGRASGALPNMCLPAGKPARDEPQMNPLAGRPSPPPRSTRSSPRHAPCAAPLAGRGWPRDIEARDRRLAPRVRRSA